MRFFKSFIPFAVFSALMFVACGDDGSPTRSLNYPEIVPNKATLLTYKCDIPAVGVKIYVKDIEKKFQCDGENWIESLDQTKPESLDSTRYVPPCRTETQDNCIYGTLTDERDGQVYKTVKIGVQWWMAENLNYAYRNGTRLLDSTSFCLRDSVHYCEEYGRLYMWSAAMDSIAWFSTNGRGCGCWKHCSPTYPVRGMCPKGWHVPKAEELYLLVRVIGGDSLAGKLLKSTSGWADGGNGVDAYGFSAKPSGFRSVYGSYSYPGKNAFFLTSSDYPLPSTVVDNYVYDLVLYHDRDDAERNDNARDDAMSVRCVKDAEY